MGKYHVTRKVVFDHVVEANNESHAEQIARCMDFDDFDDSYEVSVMAYVEDDDEDEE